MDVFEQLKRERGELLARLSRIESVLAEHEALQRKVSQLLGTDKQQVDRRDSRTAKPGDLSESGLRRVSAEVAEFERVIYEILALAPRPLNRTDLLEICVERDIHVGGQEPINTLASRMTRMEGVTNIRGKGYFLKSRLTELLPEDGKVLYSSPELVGAIVAARMDSQEGSQNANASETQETPSVFE